MNLTYLSLTLAALLLIVLRVLYYYCVIQPINHEQQKKSFATEEEINDLLKDAEANALIETIRQNSINK